MVSIHGTHHFADYRSDFAKKIRATSNQDDNIKQVAASKNFLSGYT
jgi:hypothetical protein